MSNIEMRADEPDTTAILLDVLKRAAEAHGVHEKEDLGGVYDQQWPEWYAAHMTKTLAEAGYRLTRTASQQPGEAK